MNDVADVLVNIYTDGACSGNPGPGGWGVLIEYKNLKKELFGSAQYTTNNKMEIQAAIEGIKYLKRPCKINLFTDSKYLQQGITNWIHNWERKNWKNSNNNPVKNADLWKELQKQVSKHDITWYWVKGHEDNAGNIAADQLAVKGRELAKQELHSSHN